ncbi:MAG: ADP-ribosyltransferase, partial [Candidatus Paceibacterota bacterium]
MAKNGLSEEETFMILAYTGSYSSWVNSDLINSQIPNCKCKYEFIKRLNKSLDKIISFDNQTVYRMDSPFDDKDVILNWFNMKTGCIFRIPYFLSTAKEDYKSTKIVWKVKTLPENSLGKDISDITNNQYELEVLFTTDSCFKIDSIDFDKAYINLIEVSSNTEVDFELTKRYCHNIK